MTLNDYTNELNSDILDYLNSKVYKNINANPLMVMDGVLKEPLSKLLSSPMAIQGETSYERSHREEIMNKSNQIELKLINHDLNILNILNYR